VTGDILLIAAAVVMIVVAMFLVALEAALTRVSKVSVSELQRLGISGADRLAEVVDDRARHVNVILLVRLALSTFSIVSVTVVCLSGFPEPQWLGILIATAIMLLVTFIMLGVAPRTLGQQHALTIARRGAGVAQFLTTIFGSLASLLILFGNAITPGKGYREGPFASTAELREMVDLAEADAVIEAGEREMIHSVFELGDTLAREVMVPRTEMVWIEKEKRLRQALSLALRSGFSRIPVIGENLDDVVGFVYLKDLARRSFEHRDAEQTERVEKLMRPVMFVPDSKPADELMREMQATRTHVAIVIDEYGGTAGLITIEDILEEIVGEIADEFDEQEIAESEQLADSCWRVSARMQLDDLAELLDLELSEDSEGVESVAGLLANRLGVVPIPGSSIEVEGYRLVAEMSAGRRNRVGAVFVSPIEAGEDDSAKTSEQKKTKKKADTDSSEKKKSKKAEEVSK
jgi:CBS domain containing-hemolysin-like protein